MREGLTVEGQIREEVGLINNYSWFNGSGDCQSIRQKAVGDLPATLEKHGLSLSPEWKKALEVAEKADAAGGQYTLTNVWTTVSYAIQDAQMRALNGPGLSADNIEETFTFLGDDRRQRFEASRNLPALPSPQEWLMSLK